MPENIAVALVGKAKEDFINRAKELSQTILENKEDDRFTQLCTDLNSQEGESVTFIDIRELDKYSDKESLLAIINPRCVVFYDSKRIDVPKENGGKDGAHKRNKAWQRTYEIEGTDLDLKLGILNTITKNEYDGCDYIVISLKTDDGCVVDKNIYPNGETLIVRVDAQLETSYLKGHINDEEAGNANDPSRDKNTLNKWLSKIRGR